MWPFAISPRAIVELLIFPFVQPPNAHLGSHAENPLAGHGLNIEGEVVKPLMSMLA